MKKGLYRNNAYLLLVFGYLCISINLYIGGIGILLPTFVGYILLSKASYLLCDKARIFRYAVIPSAIIALITFTFIEIGLSLYVSKYLGWLIQIIEHCIIIIHFIGIYQCAVLNNSKRIKIGLVVFAISLLALRTLWYFSFNLGISKNFSIIIYEIPKLFFTYICYLCYKYD